MTNLWLSLALNHTNAQKHTVTLVQISDAADVAKLITLLTIKNDDNWVEKEFRGVDA